MMLMELLENLVNGCKDDDVEILSESHIYLSNGSDLYHAHVNFDGKEYVLSWVPTDLEQPIDG